jgi:uncharacterized protein (TIGR02646 family)
MIQVFRTKKPAILDTKEAQWKAAIQAATTKKARLVAQNKYRNKQIKAALTEMFKGKCGYCESRIVHIDYGDIEHFRPKSIPEFYTLAVDWKNLLLACGRCNGAENKGVRFPGAGERGPLIDPTAEDPSQHLSFDFDPVTKLANILGISLRGETTWRILGLNRPELVRLRSDFVKKLWAVAVRYELDPEAKAIIDQAVNGDEEYAAFSRELKRRIDSGVFLTPPAKS